MNLGIVSYKNVKRRRRSKKLAIAISAVVGAISLLSFVPFIYLLLIGFSKQDGTAKGKYLLQSVFSAMPVILDMRNSGILALTTTILVVVISAMAGFGFAKLTYKNSKIFYGLIVSAITIPIATIIIPNYLNLAKMGGIGSFWAPILIYTVTFLPVSTVLTTSYFKSLPSSLVESALMDGASYPRIFIFILSPLAVPAFVTVGVLAFLGAWNDLLIGLLFLPNPERRTMSAGIASLQGIHSSPMNLILAASFISAIPPILAFVFFQKHLISGVTSGMGK